MVWKPLAGTIRQRAPPQCSISVLYAPPVLYEPTAQTSRPDVAAAACSVAAPVLGLGLTTHPVQASGLAATAGVAASAGVSRAATAALAVPAARDRARVIQAAVTRSARRRAAAGVTFARSASAVICGNGRRHSGAANAVAGPPGIRSTTWNATVDGKLTPACPATGAYRRA